jgi:AraC-like DNA-binding protein
MPLGEAHPGSPGERGEPSYPLVVPLMTAFCPTNVRISNPHRMDHDTRIQEAIDDLESQDRPNIAATAKRWGVTRETLSKCFQGETGSNRDATSYARRQLTDTQEQTLIKHINKLSDQGLPPTPQIVKNIAEEITHVTLERRDAREEPGVACRVSVNGTKINSKAYNRRFARWKSRIYYSHRRDMRGRIVHCACADLPGRIARSSGYMASVLPTGRTKSQAWAGLVGLVGRPLMPNVV